MGAAPPKLESLGEDRWVDGGMTETVEPRTGDASEVQMCERRDRRAAFVLGARPLCLSHALRYGPMLRRSFYTALVVGTLLTAINQGTVIASGDLSASLAWKIPLTYCVPFCVATWGALINSRIRRPSA